MRRWPSVSASLPPSTKNAASESRYPLTIHWAPVAESVSSPLSEGMASETIVWSMNIIATAKIIATSVRFRRGVGVVVGVVVIGASSRWGSEGSAMGTIPGRGGRLTSVPGYDIPRRATYAYGPAQDQ